MEFLILITDSTFILQLISSLIQVDHVWRLSASKGQLLDMFILNTS